MSRRNQIVDITKGIGILFVVLGHTALPQYIVNIIFSFHMPLFFFISGYLFNQEKYAKEVKIIFVHKFNSLIWPYLMFSFLSMFLLSIFTSYDLKTFVNDVYDTAMGMHNLNGPLWFLTALFTTEIIFSQILRTKRFKLILLLVVIIGFVNIIYFQFRLIFNIDIALIAIAFFYLGFYFQNKLKYTLNLSNIHLYILIILSLILLVALSYDQEYNMLYHEYGNIVIFFISSLCGIFFVILLSILSSKNYLSSKLFAFLGINSLIILSTHLFYAHLITDVIGVLPYRLHNLLNILFIGLSIILINKYFIWMLRLKGNK